MKKLIVLIALFQLAPAFAEPPAVPPPPPPPPLLNGEVPTNPLFPFQPHPGACSETFFNWAQQDCYHAGGPEAVSECLANLCFPEPDLTCIRRACQNYGVPPFQVGEDWWVRTACGVGYPWGGCPPGN